MGGEEEEGFGGGRGKRTVGEGRISSKGVGRSGRREWG